MVRIKAVGVANRSVHARIDNLPAALSEYPKRLSHAAVLYESTDACMLAVAGMMRHHQTGYAVVAQKFGRCRLEC